jgi:transcriptional regulator with XRE-family HTH domain
MQDLSHRIRTLRRLQKRTLKDIAERCGFTVSLLSKIESGKTVPPLATLSRIANALGVSLGDLLEPRDEKATIFTAADSGEGWTRTDKGYTFRALAAERANKLMQPILFTARRGEVRPGPLSHTGEEYVQVLEGSMKYRVGATTYTLNAGDSLYFNAEEEHDLEPVSEVVRFLAIFCERPARRAAEGL